MSEVYLAYDARADRSVVVKLMRPEQASDASLRERFLQEGRLACRCSHPNIITTYVTDEDECGPYIVMERLQGQCLRDILNVTGAMPVRDAIYVASQVAQALLYLHEIGILHRDIKPTNIFVAPNGHAKIFDFGIARGGSFGLTRAGDVIGTPNYMAPEQILGKPVDERTDIYSFGVLLFEMLAGALPYQGATIEQITAVILNAPPNVEALRARQVPEPVIRLVLACLEKAPENRPQSFRPICDGFSEFLASNSPEATARLAAQPSPTVVATSQSAPEPKKSAPWKAIVAIAAMVILAAIGFAVFELLHSRQQPAVSTATTAGEKPAAAAPAATIRGRSGEMLLVAGGAAALGNPAKPRNVVVTAFYIDKTEISQELYSRFARETGRAMPPQEKAGGSLPVVNVSFDDATAFAKWAGERLPTSEEWEKAARGPNGRKFPWGDQFEASAANVADSAKARRTLQPVDSFPAGASTYGALNMLGNVWEWVNTPGKAPAGKEFLSYKRLFSDLNPPLSPSELYYQIRGGSFSWPSDPNELAQSLWDETPLPARARTKDVGFRCARDAQ